MISKGFNFLKIAAVPACLLVLLAACTAGRESTLLNSPPPAPVVLPSQPGPSPVLQPTADSTGEPCVFPTPQTAPTRNPPPTQAAAPPGLSYKEDLSINPPPPADLKAAAFEGSILLTWQAPPPVSVPHSYGDAVLYYKVYRGSQPTALSFLACTQEYQYSDSSARPGSQYFYTVTAVHANSVESTRPDAVSAAR